MTVRSKQRYLAFVLHLVACLYGLCRIPLLEASFGIANLQRGTTIASSSSRATWMKVVSRSSDRHSNNHNQIMQRWQRRERRFIRWSLKATKQNEPPPKKDDKDEEEKKGIIGSVLNILPFVGSKEPAPPTAPQQQEPPEGGFKLKLPLDFFNKKEEPPEVTITPEERKKLELRQRAQAERERRQQEIQQQREQERRQEEIRIQTAKREAERRKNQTEELLQREKKRKKELEERRRKIQQASKATTKSATTASSSTNTEDDKGDRPFWVFWNQTKGDDDQSKEPSEETGKNPLSVAQKFLYGVWDSTVGTLTAPKEEWIVLCPKTRIAPGEIVPVVAAGLDLLVIASKDGRKVHCIANSCPHLGTPLETGTLERRPVEVGKQPTTPLSASSATSTAPPSPLAIPDTNPLQESDVAAMLAEDGCEDCIVCPLHHTAFALESGQVRGEWCPYPPILGSIMGAVKPKTSVAVFDIRTKGKNIEVRINSLLQPSTAENQ